MPVLLAGGYIRDSSGHVKALVTISKPEVDSAKYAVVWLDKAEVYEGRYVGYVIVPESDVNVVYGDVDASAVLWPDELLELYKPIRRAKLDATAVEMWLLNQHGFFYSDEASHLESMFGTLEGAPVVALGGHDTVIWFFSPRYLLDRLAPPDRLSSSLPTLGKGRWYILAMAAYILTRMGIPSVYHNGKLYVGVEESVATSALRSYPETVAMSLVKLFSKSEATTLTKIVGYYAAAYYKRKGSIPHDAKIPLLGVSVGAALAEA